MKSISILNVLRLVLCSVFKWTHLHLNKTTTLTRGSDENEMKLMFKCIGVHYYLSKLHHLKIFNISQIFGHSL